MNTEPSPFMNTAELATLLRKTPTAIRLMRYRGTGPKGMRVGKNTLYRRTDVDAWLTTRENADPYTTTAA